MPAANYALFLSTTLILSASPGPVMLSCMSNGGRYGMAKAFQGMLGASLGNLCLVGFSALGLGLLVNRYVILFMAIKWLGAAYLIYLGFRIIRQPAQHSSHHDSQQHHQQSLWLSAFFIAISNPKGFIYFGALFPQFIDYQQPLAAQFGLLTLTFLIMDLVWMFTYAGAGHKIMEWLKTPKHQTLFNLASGLILMAVGLLMAFTSNSH